MKNYLKNIKSKYHIYKRGLSKSSDRFRIIILILLLLLIPSLAIMQYLWLGQLSDAEKVRLKSNLKNSAIKFSEDFDTELTKIHNLFRIEADNKNDFLMKISDAKNKWQNSTSFQSLIDDIYLMTYSEHKGFQLKKYLNEKKEFIKTSWPQKLLHLKRHLPEKGSIAGPLILPLTHAPLLEEYPTIIMDCYSCMSISSINQDFRFDYLVISLNNDVLKGQLISHLNERYFPKSENYDFDLAIATNDDPAKVFYISDQQIKISHFSDADAVTEIGKWRKRDFIFASTAIVRQDTILESNKKIKSNRKSSIHDTLLLFNIKIVLFV